MAIDLLSVPAMLVEAERVFSGARRQILWSRASLGVEMIERMECLKHWLTKGALSNVKITVNKELIDGGCDSGSREGEEEGETCS